MAVNKQFRTAASLCLGGGMQRVGATIIEIVCWCREYQTTAGRRWRGEATRNFVLQQFLSLNVFVRFCKTTSPKRELLPSGISNRSRAALFATKKCCLGPKFCRPTSCPAQTENNVSSNETSSCFYTKTLRLHTVYWI